MRNIFLIIFFTITQLIYSQTKNSLDDQLILLRAKKIDSVEINLKNSDLSSIEKDYIKWEIQYLKNGDIDSALHHKIISNKTHSTRDQLLKKICLGKSKLIQNEYEEAYKHFIEALSLAKNNNDFLLLSIVLNNIIVLNTRVENLRELNPKYINDFIQYAPNLVEKTNAYYFHFYDKSAKTQRVDSDSLAFELNLARKSDCKFCEIKIYQRIAGVFNFLQNERDSAIKYNIKALNLLEQEKPYDYILQIKKGVFNNLGRIFSDNGEQNKALEYLTKAISINSNKDRLINDQIILENISIAYQKLGDFEKSLYYYKKSIEKSETFKEMEHATKVKKLEEQFKNAELKQNNLVIEKQSSDRKNLIIILVLLSLVISIIFLFSYLVLKRRQRFLKQERDLILKKNELQSIDAMVEGQEKERQRIANELHDDLGGLLATLKLYIQNLKVKRDNLDKEYSNIINKTDTLLEETYQKVRSLAHTQNAGILTSEGLIPTIKNYASKISASNKLIVEVIDYGMEQRLSNTLEITVFRIIQELITNVIKYANASQTTISITNHKNSINILVEDDGKGFDIEKVDSKKSTGLSNIKKRINNLKGTFDLDSYPNKGTSVIIDIPII